MRASKQRLTMLKGKIDEIIPSGDDTYGFAGISKSMILLTIDDTYKIVSLLDDYELQFEAILFERKTSEYYERATKCLKENLADNSNAFNELLNIVAKLHFRAKETYIAVAKEPIRAEAEIKKIKDNLLQLQTSLDEIKPLFTELEKIRDDSKTFISELEEKHATALTKEEEIIKNFDEITELRDAAEKAAQQIPVWEENIKKLKDDIASKSVTYEELKTKAEILKTENEGNAEKNKELLDQYSTQISDNKKFQEQIQLTIQDANRHGMAGSFKKRKDELGKALILWGVLTIASIVTLIALAYNVLIDVQDKDLQVGKIMARVPIFAACVWLGWFCAKQYGFTSRVMEDYSYKYAVSMAFEGYKKATNEIDQDLQLKLLEMTIFNISNSPLNIYETNNNDGTPYHELFKNLPKTFSFKKKIDKVETETKVSN